MDWHIILAVLSGILCFASVVPYVRDIVYGTTRPNITTWFLWLFIQVIAIAVQFHEGASWSIVMVIADAITIALVFFLSVVGYGYRLYTTFDMWCGILGVIAILSWQMTGNALYALAFAIIADICAALPTIKKAYLDPWSENPTGWASTMVAAILAIASTTRFDLANVLFPAYLVIINALTFTLAFSGRRSQNKPIKDVIIK